MNRSVHGRRRCSSRSAATAVPAAGTCGAKTSARSRSRAPGSRAVGCVGRCRRSSASTRRWRGSPKPSGWRGAPPTTRSWPRGKRVLIADAHRLDGVRVLGVDEHVWRHTRHGDKYVTVVIDLTGIRDGTGPAQLLDMVEGRSEQVFKTWLTERLQTWRDALEVVAMDGFTGFETATTEELPEAVAVMDPFHVVRLAADALDQCRRRVQQDTCRHRGRTGDPLYSSRRTLHTGAGLLIDTLRRGVPSALSELITLRPDPAPPSRRRPRLLRPARHQQRPHRGHLWPAQTPARQRHQLPQPHQPHREKRYSRASASDHKYTVDCEEPDNLAGPGDLGRTSRAQEAGYLGMAWRSPAP